MSDARAAGPCQALTRSGRPCKNPAQPGSAYCRLHGARPAGESAAAAEPPDAAELRRRFFVELDELAERLRELEASRSTPPGSLGRLAGRLRSAVAQGALEPETLKGVWYMARHTAGYQRDVLRRRLKGDFETDEWGLDWDILEVVRPFLDFMAKVYWRAETAGLMHVPAYGRAMLVSNHSAQAAWDGMLFTAVLLSVHPAQRLVRVLYPEWYPRVPFLSPLLSKIGQTLATVENGVGLLEQDELVGLFPEGAATLAQPPGQLAPFGRSDLATMAIKSGAPIIPVAITAGPVGVPAPARVVTMARSLKPPFAAAARQIALAPLGLVPLPLKWTVEFGPPLETAAYGADAAGDMVLVSRLTDEVRAVIQQMVTARMETARPRRG